MIMKTLIAAAFAACAAFVAPNFVTAAAAQPQLILQPGIDTGGSNLIQVGSGGDRWDREDRADYYHWKKRHRKNGIYLQFGFGHPGWYNYGYAPGIIYRPRPVIRPYPGITLTRAHISWCYDRYRTYNHETNLYVVRRGQHRHCVSPYSN
jgi:opacity protein-like surface antigen